ncbi:MAG: hypothetical protein GC138_07840 [Gammaproteobacteria bacterium]|nr:hypothetical protein [Gammaproteobacteria bacterium]
MPYRLISSVLLVLACCLATSRASAATCGYSETFRDEFSSISYGGNNGSQNWTSDWQEISDDNRAKNGYVRVVSEQSGLSLRIKSSKQERGIQRTADLSAYTGATTATLSFDYRRYSFNGSDNISVQISTGGSNWTEIGRVSGNGSDTAYQTFSASILGYVSGSTRIRFIASSTSGENGYTFYIDNVTISVGCSAGVGGSGSACNYTETFIDQFNSIGYDGNDGTQNWSADWREISDDNRAGEGYVRVVSDQSGLSLRLRSSYYERGIERTANLSAYSAATSATLSFDYRRYSFNSSDHVRVEISTDGSSWTEIGRISGYGSDTAYRNFSVSILGYLSATTSVRFIGSSNGGENGYVAYIDNVAISTGCSGSGGGTCNYAETFADEFRSRAYNRNDGSQNWADDWQEFGDDGRASEGSVRVVSYDPGYVLQIGVFSRQQRGVQRSLDLSPYSNATSATLSFNYRRSGLRRDSDYVAVEISTDGNHWSELGRVSGAGSDSGFQPFSVSIMDYLSANTQIRFISSSSYNEDYRVYVDNVVISVGCIGGTNGTDHLKIVHDGLGIHCLAEPIAIQAILASGQVDTTYTGNITLDTGTGSGTWSLMTGHGTFSDPVSDDGRATYHYVATDQGQAAFLLTYRSGSAVVNVAASDGTISDDDTEGNLVFSPSGFVVTPAAQSNPPAIPIDTAIPAQTAAQGFQLYLTAYGQSSTNAQCGVIESYTGDHALRFWSDYLNPASGTRALSVNNHSISTTEAGAGQITVAFSQGQAAISVNYADAGEVGLNLKDDATTNPDLPGGIAGSSDAFVVKPAGFTLENIRRTADGFANPAATDASGAVFIGAGRPFTVQVTAIDATGSPTPNFGQETPQESVLLTPALVAPTGGHNPPIDAQQGFDGSFSNGVATGTDFAWPEIGIITLTPSIGDGSYLDAGDVTGTASGHVGRFIPADFRIDAGATPALHTQCDTFSYLNQPVDYAVAPTVTVTAIAATGQTTQNYQGDWWKLADFGESYAHNGPIPSTASLDAGGLNHTPLACPDCGGSASTQFGGTLAYGATAAETDPFVGALDIAFPIVDSDGAAYSGNPFRISAIAFDQGGEIRSGRGYAKDAYGTYARIGDSLPIALGSQYYDSLSGGWIANTADSCSIVAYTATDSDVTTSASPTGQTTLNGGLADVVLTLTGDPGTPGGKTQLNLSWPAWLDGQTSATASFGLFRGDDRRIHWSEAH